MSASGLIQKLRERKGTALSVALFRYVLNLPIPILIIPGVLVL